MTLCPHCQQVMPELREGVRLSPLKARIFDLIRRAGFDGISGEDINAIVFDGDASPVTVRAHIYQINEAFADAGLQITGSTGGIRGFYHIVRAARAPA